jgi:hypothetical protein
MHPAFRGVERQWDRRAGRLADLCNDFILAPFYDADPFNKQGLRHGRNLSARCRRERRDLREHDYQTAKNKPAGAFGASGVRSAFKGAKNAELRIRI